MNDALELELQNSLEELDRLHMALEGFGEEHALPARVVFELTLALDEWVTNIVSYGYTDGTPHTIAVRLRLDRRTGGTTLVTEIEDDARPFDPLKVPPPHLDVPLEDRTIGGLGIHFIRRCMDDVAYERRGDHNVLLLHKRVVG